MTRGVPAGPKPSRFRGDRRGDVDIGQGSWPRRLSPALQPRPGISGSGEEGGASGREWVWTRDTVAGLCPRAAERTCLRCEPPRQRGWASRRCRRRVTCPLGRPGAVWAPRPQGEGGGVRGRRPFQACSQFLPGARPAKTPCASTWRPQKPSPGGTCPGKEAQQGQPPGRPGLTPSPVRGVSGCWLLALRLAWLLRALTKFLSMRLRHSSHLQTRLLTDAGSPAGRRHPSCGSGNRQGTQSPGSRQPHPLLPPACSAPTSPCSAESPWGRRCHPHSTWRPCVHLPDACGMHLARPRPPWLRRPAPHLAVEAAGSSSEQISLRAD